MPPETGIPYGDWPPHGDYLRAFKIGGTVAPAPTPRPPVVRWPVSGDRSRAAPSTTLVIGRKAPLRRGVLPSSLKDRFAIVGLGMIVGPNDSYQPGRTARTMETEAARLAIEDAGLRREDIDGYVHVHGGPRSGRGMSEFTDAPPRVRVSGRRGAGRRGQPRADARPVVRDRRRADRAGLGAER